MMNRTLSIEQLDQGGGTDEEQHMYLERLDLDPNLMADAKALTFTYDEEGNLVSIRTQTEL